VRRKTREKIEMWKLKRTSGTATVSSAVETMLGGPI